MGAHTFFVLLFALLTVITRFSGVFSMAHGGEDDRRVSHLLMFKRVGWQAAAIFFIFMTLLAEH